VLTDLKNYWLQKITIAISFDKSQHSLDEKREAMATI